MRIVLALDESSYAKAIAKWMTGFPHPMNTRLTLVQVLEPLDLPASLGADRRAVIEAQRLTEARTRLDGIEGMLEKSYSGIEAIVCEGFPIYELLKILRDKPPDIIVAGTRGLRAERGLALGSVSQRLLTYAPCSVLLLPLSAKPMRRMRIMLATDGSRGAKTAARLLTVIPDLKEIEVVSTVRPVHNRELEREQTDRSQFPSMRALLTRGRREAATRAVAETVKVLAPSGVSVRRRIVTGHAAEAIPRLAKQEQRELLVLGSRGLTGMMATAMGSVSLAVAQSVPCPVLIVKRTV
jgi:nucleotide-binding universal stress UspA family protein